uniref:Uncharacterized protein n=1 Tax=Myotis myotis TaxID=51298 RepID=A0A7J7Z507_MYOMY|nr:hypothetical protein mMyoMyo1_010648 [Myotis myotis]
MKGLAFPFFSRAHVENRKNSLHLPNRGDLSKESLFKKFRQRKSFLLRKGICDSGDVPSSTNHSCIIGRGGGGGGGGGSQPVARMSDNKEMLTRGRQYCKLFREQCICARHQDCSTACGQAHEAVTTLVLDSH